MVEELETSNQKWRTPDWLFEICEELLGTKLVLDAAASKENAKCRKFYDEAKNGLLQPWVDGTFCNPGYRIFGAWIKKAVDECRTKNIRAVLIGPKGCSQTWFHEYVRQGRIYAPDRRVAFNHPVTGEPTITAREDSMIYLLGPGFWNDSMETGRFDLRALAVR